MESKLIDRINKKYIDYEKGEFKWKQKLLM